MYDTTSSCGGISINGLATIAALVLLTSYPRKVESAPIPAGFAERFTAVNGIRLSPARDTG